MKIIRWAAIIVTALFVLMNLGAVGDSDVSTWLRIGGAVIAAAGVVAAVGMAMNKPWGRAAVMAVGTLNVLGGIGAVVDDQSGAAAGIVVGGLAVVLAALSGQPEAARARA